VLVPLETQQLRLLPLPASAIASGGAAAQSAIFRCSLGGANTPPLLFSAPLLAIAAALAALPSIGVPVAQEAELGLIPLACRRRPAAAAAASSAPTTSLAVTGCYPAAWRALRLGFTAGSATSPGLGLPLLACSGGVAVARLAPGSASGPGGVLVLKCVPGAGGSGGSGGSAQLPGSATLPAALAALGALRAPLSAAPVAVSTALDPGGPGL
jgi:hypothetical protein